MRTKSRRRFAIGQRFGRLVITDLLKKRHAVVRCDCGVQKTVQLPNLSSGQTRSCGCLYVESRHWKRPRRIPPRDCCQRGHLFTPANTFVTPRGKRGCRTCKQARETKARIHGHPAAATGDQICSTCSQSKSVQSFAADPRARNGRSYRCLACDDIRGAALHQKRTAFWRQHDPYQEHPTGKKICPRCTVDCEVRRFSRGRSNADGLQNVCRTCQVVAWQLRTFGVSSDGKSCEICGATARVGVDHNHVTLAIRGFLCTQCNTALGLLKESPQRLRAMIAYIERF